MINFTEDYDPWKFGLGIPFYRGVEEEDTWFTSAYGNIGIGCVVITHVSAGLRRNILMAFLDKHLEVLWTWCGKENRGSRCLVAGSGTGAGVPATSLPTFCMQTSPKSRGTAVSQSFLRE